MCVFPCAAKGSAASLCAALGDSTSYAGDALRLALGPQTFSWIPGFDGFAASQPAAYGPVRNQGDCYTWWVQCCDTIAGVSAQKPPKVPRPKGVGQNVAKWQQLLVCCYPRSTLFSAPHGGTGSFTALGDLRSPRSCRFNTDSVPGGLWWLFRPP